ncbi:Cysteine dioxygenase [Paenibacillus konkukensis]|uniref:Cysteine dioxygenase n=1 Tax=Paenibacillus konkukensis TaxID=2020716 RepID=A0ABY4RWK0_9BACL|nr:cysteine dioxygenase family protein [Paenibacillus konkukensis]UQZ86522.1 Cysteine dioxygenase [Paenibacillus konkukensis]
MKLLESIEQAFRNMTDPSPYDLRQAIQQLELKEEEVSSYVAEPSYLPYGRKVLFQSEVVEVILIHLPAGRETMIHDHGASRGCAYVVEGELTNKIYELGAEGYVDESGESVVKQGQFLYAPEGMIHQMCNTGTRRVVSLHAYTPAMSNTKVYHTYEQVLDYVI